MEIGVEEHDGDVRF